MDAILVLDFGGQYAHLIGRRVREHNVYSEVVPYRIGLEQIRKLEKRYDIKGIIFSGGPSSVYEEGAPKVSPEILNMDVPVLGICYGHQLIANMVGGIVEPAEKKEYGIIYPTIVDENTLLKRLDQKEKAWTSHADTVRELPSEFEVLAKTKNCPVAAFAHANRGIYGVQWHPEVTHTEHGDKIFQNFLFDICGCDGNWNLKDFAKKSIEKIKNTVDGKKCIIAISGGIDSSTAAVLASRAIGENLVGVFVDHGLMREREPEEVKEIFEDLEMDFIFLDKKERFLKKLKGVIDPEEKRKIIGEEFIRVFEEIAKKVEADYLIQGTIYPDWIESGSEDNAALIKTHHNVGGLPEKLDFEGIIEPLRELYKDEVREIARNLGISSTIVERQPFPGPGLAVRIIGEITPEKLNILKKADWIFREEIEDAGLDKKLWQYFAVLPGIRSTGVKGDARDYGYVIALRAVESKEAMTASFSKISYDFLEDVSTRITNEIPEVTRVVYDITHKPPSTIEWE